GLMRKKNQRWLLIFAAHMPKNRVPRVLGIGEHDRDKPRQVILRRIRIDLARGWWLRLLGRVQQRLGVAAEEKIDHDQDGPADAAADRDPATTTTTTGPAFVFDVIAFSLPAPEHNPVTQQSDDN